MLGTLLRNEFWIETTALGDIVAWSDWFIGSNVWAIAGTASQSFAGRFSARNCGFAAHACSEGGGILHGF
jgi:hypothetical protein